MSKTAKVIVTGGAGYIGSHAVLALKEKGFDVNIVDNLCTGSREIAQTLGVPLHEGSVLDAAFLDKLFSKLKPDAVMHFAAHAYVGESVSEPEKYYLNNTQGTLTLLQAMRRLKIGYFIFSSTCAVYGVPAKLPITEDCPTAPISPYGRSKRAVEDIIQDFASAYNLKPIMFRYFNAAGAHPSASIGERHDPETHLIPLTLRATQGNFRLKVFGNDYATPDGTCVRDYIHVCDLADVHVKGLEYLLAGNAGGIFNIGTGRGHSVSEVIKSVERVTGLKVAYDLVSRREGDPPFLVASADKLKAQLGWTASYLELDKTVASAWRWEQSEMARNSRQLTHASSSR